MDEQLDPRVAEAVNGVWKTHQGLQEDQIIAVLHEAVRAVGAELPEEEYRRIGFAIANGTWR